MSETTTRREGRDDRGDGTGCCDDGADASELEERRQSVLKRRRVVRAKLAQQAREKYKEGVVDQLPAHRVEITPGWKAYPIITGKKYDVYRFEGTAETAVPRHRHPNHLEILYIASGEVNLRIGRNDERLECAETQRIEPDTEHEIICASRNATILSIFQPPISIGPNEEDQGGASIDSDKIFQRYK